MAAVGRRLHLDRILPSELWQKIDSGDTVLVIDLLRYQDDSEDLDGIPSSVRLDPSKISESPHILFPSDLNVVLYCTSPDHFRSARVADTQKSRHPTYSGAGRRPERLAQKGVALEPPPAVGCRSYLALQNPNRPEASDDDIATVMPFRHLMWKLVGVTIIGGMVTGFALPIAASYQTAKFYVPASAAAMPDLLEIPPAPDRDSEIAKLKARNLELEALVATLELSRK